MSSCPRRQALRSPPFWRRGRPLSRTTPRLTGSGKRRSAQRLISGRVTPTCPSVSRRATVVRSFSATRVAAASRPARGIHSAGRVVGCIRKRRNPRRTGGFSGGARYWDRTSDLFRVREARYRCANRAYTGCSIVRRGGDGIRTRVNGFAGRCLAARPRHRDVVRPTCRDAPSVSQTEIPPLERMTRLELATPTLARLCATNCATSAFRSRGLPRALVRHYPI